jgi:hypothetical protein
MFLTSETGAVDVQVEVQPYPGVWQLLTEVGANVDAHEHEVRCYYSQPKMSPVLTADGYESWKQTSVCTIPHWNIQRRHKVIKKNHLSYFPRNINSLSV